MGKTQKGVFFMIKLNNCIDCGREPWIKFYTSIGYNMLCRCGKNVSANAGNHWSQEVAADMWNRANPKLGEHINDLADRAAKAGIKPVIRQSEFGEWLDFTGGNYMNAERCLLATELYDNKPQLLAFYRKRLEPAHG
jgi:hypothetical protein